MICDLSRFFIFAFPAGTPMEPVFGDARHAYAGEYSLGKQRLKWTGMCMGFFNPRFVNPHARDSAPIPVLYFV